MSTDEIKAAAAGAVGEATAVPDTSVSPTTSASPTAPAAVPQPVQPPVTAAEAVVPKPAEVQVPPVAPAPVVPQPQASVKAVLPGPTAPLDSHPDNVRAFCSKYGCTAPRLRRILLRWQRWMS